MKLWSDSFPDGGTIPSLYAFGVPDPVDHVSFGPNRNPHLAWSDPPEGTRSFALVCHDPDAPTVPDDVNQEGRTVPADLPRGEFFHWVLVDIPADAREIPEGAVAGGVQPRGKAPESTEFGRSGRNDYTAWFADDPAMKGVYAGYDGPCPPWNDERLHRYHFVLYALDTDRLDLPDDFGGLDVLHAVKGHVLADAQWTGTYSLNPTARRT
jgi:Raf kinase inhibitor-like YbhB/YbcL family protein